MTKDEIYDILNNSKRQIDAIKQLNIRYEGVNGSYVLTQLKDIANSVEFYGDLSGKGFRERYKQHQIEEYLKNPKICPICGKMIPFDKRNNKTCSQSCAISISNTGKKHTKEHNENISKGLYKYYSENTPNNIGRIPWNKGKSTKKKEQQNIKIFITLKSAIEQGLIENPHNAEYKDHIFLLSSNLFKEKECSVCHKRYRPFLTEKGKLSKSKTCSDECHKKLAIINGYKAHESAVKNGTFKPWQSRNIISYAEKFWTTVLDNNNIKYQREFFFDKKYFLDFYIEVDNVKIDLEIDGKQHKYEDRKIHDIKRDKYLESKDVIVYRIEWNDIKTEKGSKLMKEKIDGFVDFYNRKTSGCGLQTAVKS